MDIFTLARLDERHSAYDEVATANHRRLLGFLESMVGAALELEQPMVTHHLIRGLNAHAIAGLHSAAGQYRSSSLVVGGYIPPEPGLVPLLMDDCVMEIGRRWNESGAISLGAWALWRINNIHPFVNGNGRTARALCYYIMCVKLGGWLPGSVILPNRLKERREEYVEALGIADTGDLQPLSDLVKKLLDEQLAE